ncbi:GAF domain-containing protein [Streptomyces sp. NPDC091215]|uniref:GAF domain-containing protein n=1 Tax=Streptomyces sp. NPDC091215 TaxID=3155192 RepID=UPI003423ACE4
MNSRAASDTSLLENLLHVVDAAAGGQVDQTLDSIVDVATSFVSESLAATVVLVDGQVSSGLRLAACRGLSRSYQDTMEKEPDQFRASVTARAIREQRPLLVRDILGDPDYSRWWQMARDEGYRAILATPMMVGGTAIGSLNIYRRTTGDLPPSDILLVDMFARVAAGVLQTSRLLSDRDNQVTALARLVQALQDQAHEHSNRLQAIRGLIAIGEPDRALSFISEITEATASVRSEISTRIKHPTLAGLLVSLTEVAAQQDIKVTIDPDSHLERLPANLSDSQVVTVVGNLVDNAIAAVAEEPPRRRLVRVAVKSEQEHLVIEVRDWGSGLAMPFSQALTWGESSRVGHLGAGLNLVHRAVTAALGVLEATSSGSGTTFTVRVPDIDATRTPPTDLPGV